MRRYNTKAKSNEVLKITKPNKKILAVGNIDPGDYMRYSQGEMVVCLVAEGIFKVLLQKNILSKNFPEGNVLILSFVQ